MLGEAVGLIADVLEQLEGRGAVNIAEPISELTEGLELHNVEVRQTGDDIRLSGLSKKAIDEIANL